MRFRRTLEVARWKRLSPAVWLCVLCGCALLPPNSFLDPTKVGRFPLDTHESGIRRVLSPRETPPGLANATDPTPEDLVAEYSDYRLAPGDVLGLSIQDLLVPGAPFSVQLEVSPLGEIRIPDLGSVKVTGLTEQEVELEITARLKEAGLLPRPVVIAIAQVKRGRIVSVMGGVGGPGAYPLSDPTMRMLDLIAMIGDVTPQTRRAYLIRRVSTTAAEPERPVPEIPAHEGWIIPPPVEEAPPPPGGFMSTGWFNQEVPPEPDEPPTREELAEILAPEKPPAEVAPPAEPPFEPIVIFDPQTGQVLAPRTPPVVEGPAAPEVPVPPVFEEPFDWEAVEELALEQRVIAIDLVSLRAGDPRQNIVIRDRDVFHVPVDTGVFYIMGEVQRPGVYAFGGREITIKQALAICGGFSPLAWPSRSELIRREPGTDKQFTRLINLDAIFAGLEDDLYLRDDDIVNVGTHIVAPFLFVIRNSFRFTYGFGFVYDRNFADKDAYSSKINPEIFAQQRRQQRGLPF